jgi:hypothetical protein
MIRWLPASLALVALLGSCTPSLAEVTTTNTSGSSGSTAMTTATAGSTTLPHADTIGTQAGTGLDTTMEAVDTTATTSVEPTTSSTSNTSSGPSPACPGGCDSNEICENGTCVEACGGAWGEGSYGYCLSDYGGALELDALCGPGHVCAQRGDPIEQTACALQGCEDACDCPPPPASGNATVTCGELTVPEDVNDCYLSCADGETCPDGMSCIDDTACMTDTPEVPVYGDCGNLAPDCTGTAFCATLPSGESVCSMGCMNALQCPGAFPRGGDAIPACSNVTTDGPGQECYLSCIGGVACPDEMVCVNDTFCAWPD